MVDGAINDLSGTYGVESPAAKNQTKASVSDIASFSVFASFIVLYLGMIVLGVPIQAQPCTVTCKKL